MTAIATAYRAGWDAWTHGPIPDEWDVSRAKYGEKWAAYSGELFQHLAQQPEIKTHPEIYQHTTLLWKHHEAVVDFYAGVIYQGALSTDGKPLPDGTLGAIPIDPQVPEPNVPEAVEGQEERAETPNGDRLRRAIAELWAAWNWQQQMSLRPMYGAALGDCLTELVDDTERRFVYPQIVWPGYVKEIELDYVGNVRRYVLEYRVERKDDRGQLKAWMYRKEVDKETFRHFRDDQPYDEHGPGTAVTVNAYGFVPAIWDRHRIAAPGMARGKSATDGTRQALMQLNSLFSHAFDFQHKAFWVPFMVAGAGRGGTKDVDLGAPPQASSLAETYKWISVPPDATLLQPQFDTGKTLDMLKDLREGILAENPEASFYQQMRQMQQVTAPGAERLMGDVKNRVDLARAGYDIQTVKLFQMAVAMCGERANDRSRNGWQRRGAPRLDRKRLAFLEYDLRSFDQGELDFSIQSRPLVAPTETERVELVLLKEGLQSDWGMRAVGIEPDDIEAILAARRDRFAFGVDTGLAGEEDFGEGRSAA